MYFEQTGCFDVTLWNSTDVCPPLQLVTLAALVQNTSISYGRIVLSFFYRTS